MPTTADILALQAILARLEENENAKKHNRGE